MMRNRERVIVAVRRPDGSIALHSERASPLYRSRLAKMPFCRGILALWDALGTGIKALMYSAEVAAGQEAELGAVALWGTAALSVALAILLFMLLPAFIAGLLSNVLRGALLQSLAESLIRVGLFLGYVLAISRVPEVARVLAYHGAEHKVSNAYEARAELSVESAMRHRTSHPRCGTSFLLNLVLLSIVLFTLFGEQPLLLRLGTRLLAIPLLAALSYELMRLLARHSSNPLARAFMAPAVGLQSLTAKEPSPDMVEVALAAFTALRAGPAETPSMATGSATD